MNKIKRILAGLLLAATILSLVSCGGDGGKTVETTEPEEVVKTPKYTLTLADLGNNVEIHTKDQLAYLNDPSPDSVKNYVPDTYTERSYPKAVELSWTVYDNENDLDYVPYITYKLKVATKADFSDAKEYKTREEYYSLINLFIGTTYYWQVSFESEGETYESEVKSFTTTSKGPRNLKIEGVTNCRDLGGWATADGNRVKQGMLYRTAKLGWTNKDLITRDGKKTMTDELGIKSEIDLRNGETEIRETSTLSGVELFNFGVSGSGKENMESILPGIFEVLADESNYPLFFHCAAGADRTGVVAYLVLALLGVSEKDILRDYAFTNFGAITTEKNGSQFRTPTTFKRDGFVIDTVNSSSGSTLQEKCRNYLKSIGITDATLDKVVELMTEVK